MVKRFNKGDKVRTKKDLTVGNRYGYITLQESMVVRDEPITIESGPDSDGDYYCSNGYYYNGKMLELASPQFKVGDRVKAISAVGNSDLKDIFGTIIEFQGSNYFLPYLVEFDDYIKGHNGNGIGKVSGKAGHCWWCEEAQLEAAPYAKFKVGDMVIGNNNDYWITNNGWIGKVVQINSNGTFNAKGKDLWGTEHTFEQLYVEDFNLYTNDQPTKIVITTEGTTTMAKMYRGETLIDTKTTKCHPDDTFDFKVGARVAFDRLVGETTEKKEEAETPNYKIGDKVIIGKSNIGNKYCGSVGEIVKIDLGYDYPYAVRTSAYPSGNLWCKVSDYAPKDALKIEIGKKYKIKDYDEVADHLSIPRHHWESIQNSGGVTIKSKTPDDNYQIDSGWCIAPEAFECEWEEPKEPTTLSIDGFKVGDKVIWGKYNATIICISDDYKYAKACIGIEVHSDEFDGHKCSGFTLADGKCGTKDNCWWVRASEIKHGELPKYYNGKVVCVDTTDTTCGYVLGKIYEIKDGYLYKDGCAFYPTTPVSTLAEFNSRSNAKWLEVVE